jgi:hypothetical protein
MPREPKYAIGDMIWDEDNNLHYLIEDIIYPNRPTVMYCYRVLETNNHARWPVMFFESTGRHKVA